MARIFTNPRPGRILRAKLGSFHNSSRTRGHRGTRRDKRSSPSTSLQRTRRSAPQSPPHLTAELGSFLNFSRNADCRAIASRRNRRIGTFLNLCRLGSGLRGARRRRLSTSEDPDYAGANSARDKLRRDILRHPPHTAIRTLHPPHSTCTSAPLLNPPESERRGPDLTGRKRNSHAGLRRAQSRRASNGDWRIERGRSKLYFSGVPVSFADTVSFASCNRLRG